jgi:NAD(P)H-hydrate repair Nnr-like enzyme with NAD(P)H-hydrate dehydratase domain
VQDGSQDELACFMDAALNAAELVRLAQSKAYQERGRSMVASDMLHALQPAVAAAWPLKD